MSLAKYVLVNDLVVPLVGASLQGSGIDKLLDPAELVLDQPVFLVPDKVIRTRVP